MRKAIAWLLLIPVLPVHANDADSDEAFFEFLGTFGDADEGWTDPLWLEDVNLQVTDDEEDINEHKDNETTSDDNDEQ